MKKRFISLALTVALLITLIPMAAIPAKAAANFTVSQECIDIIKKWEGFSAKPYWDYQQWTVGYGTRVPDGKLEEYQTVGITKEDAEQQLLDYLNKDAQVVNQFIDKYGLTFTQGMFDAVLSLSYNCGSSWLNKTSTLHTAVVSGWTGDDLLFAFGQWSTAGGETVPALIRRRLAEANMYLNGIYDYNLPSNISYVRFDPNGGTCEIKTQGYDTNANPEIRAVPTYEGYKFEGWYTDATGGEKITNLDEGVKTYTLYAHWSAAEGEGLPQDPNQETITGTAVNYQRQIATAVLNSFDNPVKGALVVNAHKQDTVVEIVAEYTDTSGTKWGKVKNGGWINLTYTTEVKIDSTPTETVTVTVTATDVNIRKGPGTGYGLSGKADTGDKLVITEVATGSGYTWGKSDKGWIALKYTNYSTVTGGSNNSNNTTGNNNVETESNNSNTNNNNSNNSSNTGSTAVKITGKVTLSSGTLNVRNGAGTGNKVVSYYANGATVTILEQKTVGSTIWGRTDRGWISLDYVKLDATTDNTDTNTGNTGNTDTNTGNTGNTDTNTGNTGNTDTNTDDTGNADTNTGNTGNTDTNTGNSGNTDTNTGSTGNTDTNTGNTGNTDTNTGNTDTNTDNIGSNNSTSTAITGKIKVSSGYLNIRKDATTSSAVVGRLNPNATVTIYETKTVGSVVWGRTSQGWVCMDYVVVSSGNTDSKSVSGTVTTKDSALRIRAGAGTGFNIVGYLNNGDRVEILEQKDVNGSTWGRIAKGWIMMGYVKLDGSGDSNTNSNTGNDNNTANSGNNGTSTDSANTTTKTGTVTLQSQTLNVRAGAGTNYNVVSYLVNGAKVTILETKEVNGVTWGRISNGWVCMDYIK